MTTQMKNYLLWGVGALILIGLVWWGQSNQEAGREGEKVKVGVIAPLTGILSDYGIAFRNGFELAVEDFPNQNVEFIFEDNEWDPKKAISAFNKLTEVDKVAVIMDWGAPTSQAIAPLVESAGTPFIAVSIDPSVTQASDLIIRGDLNQPKDFGEKMWEYLREEGMKNIAVVKTEHLFPNIMLDAFIAAKHSDENVTIIDTYQPSEQDFRSSITKIRAGNFDALGIYLISGQISQFYRQTQQLGLTTETFGTDFFESQSEIDAAQGTMEGAVYPNMDVAQKFKDKYLARFSNLSQITFAGGGYDLAHMLLQEVDYSNQQSVLESLKNLKGFDGVKGEYRYVETEGDRYFSKPTYIKKIENGSIITIR